MVKGPDLKGILGVGFFTTLAFIGYFILAYLYFLLCDTFDDNAGYRISGHMPSIGPLFLSFTAFTFIVTACEMCRPVSEAKNIDLRAASWLWVSSIIILVCLPSLLQASMLSQYSDSKNNLMFYILLYEIPDPTRNDVQKLYKVFLGAAVFLCVLFSIVNAKMLYRAKVSDADDGDDLRSYFSVGSAFFALLFASFILSLYLIISHTQQGYLNSILSERNLNFVVQMYLYFYFLVGAIIFASKRYAKYVFTPWIYGLIAGGKYFLLFSVLMVLYVGFWLLVFNQFLQGLSTHQLDQAVSKLFLYAMVKVIMNIADSVVVVFEYADDLASAMYHFAALVWNGCKIIIVTVFKKIKENVGVTIGLLLAALAILKIKDVANFGSQSSKKLTGFMHGAGGVVTKSLVLVGFVAIGYGLFKAVKLIDAGKFPLQFEINWKVEPQDIYQVAVDCRRHSQVQMVDYSDVGIVAHNDCRFSFPSDENHCDWQAVVALENFVGVGDNRSTLDSARQRGVAVINQFLIEYRKECNDQHGKPKLFVLNIGSPKKASQPPRDELSSEVFLTRYGASELQLRKLLQSRVSADEFQYWKLVDVSQELY